MREVTNQWTKINFTKNGAILGYYSSSSLDFNWKAAQVASFSRYLMFYLSTKFDTNLTSDYTSL
jgi:hypothetical protein